MPRPLLTVLFLLCALLAPATASAGMSQESIFEDEGQIIGLGNLDAVDEMAALGADTIRSIVYWDDVAPSPTARKVPSGFDADDPASYPAGGWDRYDAFVRRANALGLNVLLTPSSPIPRWASGCKGAGARKAASCRPNVKLFEGFVEVLGRRYSGTYADENGGGALPRVDRWSIWNEPNVPTWLKPQYTGSKGSPRPESAIRYRALALAGLRALRASGHGSDELLLAETAPLGRTSGPVADRQATPVDFINNLLCLTSRGGKLRGAAAKRAGCKKAPSFRVSGFAHHPYARGGSAPPLSRAGKGEIRISNIRKLFGILDDAARHGRLPKRLPVWFTEFGFQTNPPDRVLGVKPGEQARFLNQSDYLASKINRVKSVAQYKLIDEQDQAGFQTGLRRFGTLRKKPGYKAYRLPIWVGRKGRRVKVYGQLRTAAAGATEQVEVQRRPSKGGSWTTVKTVTVSSALGHFVTRTARRSGVWRLRWTPSGGGATLTSRVAEVGNS
jgi:hypothetical protein